MTSVDQRPRHHMKSVQCENTSLMNKYIMSYYTDPRNTPLEHIYARVQNLEYISRGVVGMYSRKPMKNRSTRA